MIDISPTLAPTSPADGSRRPLLTSDRAFGLLVLLYLVPIWAFSYLPTQDGPSHVNNARVLAELGGPDGGFLREYYALTKGFVPTWLGHRVLAGLLSVLAPPVAEKVFVSGYVVLLPLAMRFALRSIRRDSAFVGVLVFPFVLSFPFHMGFYAFSYSLAVYLFVLGIWLRIQRGPTVWSLVALALLAGGLYLTHLFSLLMLVGGLVVLCGWVLAARAVGSRAAGAVAAGPWGLIDGRSLLSLALFLPALAPVALFVAGQGSERLFETGVAERAGELLYLSAIVSYGWPEKIVGRIIVGLFLVVALLTLAGRRSGARVQAGDGLLAGAGSYGVLYFVAPDAMSNGAFIPVRIMLFVFLMLILWLGAQDFSPRGRRLIGVAGTVVALAVLALQTVNYRTLDGYLDEYLSVAPRIEPGTTLLALSLSYPGSPPGGPPPSPWVRPFLHAAERIAAEKPVIVFPNYQPATGYFPTVWRPGLNPYANIGFMEAEPPRVEFLDYPERTGRPLDYVLLWGKGDETDPHPAIRAIFRQLDAGYEPVYRSPKRGLVRLYRRKPTAGNGAELPGTGTRPVTPP